MQNIVHHNEDMHIDNMDAESTCNKLGKKVTDY